MKLFLLPTIWDDGISMFRGVSTMFPMFCSPQLFSFLIVVVFHWKLVILFSNSRGRHCAIFVFCRTTSSFLFMERFSREVDLVNCLISSGGIFNRIIASDFPRNSYLNFWPVNVWLQLGLIWLILVMLSIQSSGLSLFFDLVHTPSRFFVHRIFSKCNKFELNCYSIAIELCSEHFLSKPPKNHEQCRFSKVSCAPLVCIPVLWTKKTEINPKWWISSFFSILNVFLVLPVYYLNEGFKVCCESFRS